MLPIVQVGERGAGDLSETWWMVAASVAASCLLSFAWLLLMRLVAGPMVWLSVLGVVAALAAATAYSALRLAAAARSTDPAVAANFLQVRHQILLSTAVFLVSSGGQSGNEQNMKISTLGCNICNILDQKLPLGCGNDLRTPQVQRVSTLAWCVKSVGSDHNIGLLWKQPCGEE